MNLGKKDIEDEQEEAPKKGNRIVKIIKPIMIILGIILLTLSAVWLGLKLRPAPQPNFIGASELVPVGEQAQPPSFCDDCVNNWENCQAMNETKSGFEKECRCLEYKPYVPEWLDLAERYVNTCIHSVNVTIPLDDNFYTDELRLPAEEDIFLSRHHYHVYYLDYESYESGDYEPLNENIPGYRYDYCYNKTGNMECDKINGTRFICKPEIIKKCDGRKVRLDFYNGETAMDITSTQHECDAWHDELINRYNLSFSKDAFVMYNEMNKILESYKNLITNVCIKAEEMK